MNKAKIEKWKRLQATLKTVKKQEMELRKELANEILQGKIGTVNLVKFGYELKAQQSKRYKVDSEVLLMLWPTLTEEEKASVIWKPEVVVSNYKALTDKERLNSAITTVPNAATLTVKKV